LTKISDFDIEIKYIKGKENKVGDALSKRIQVNHIAVMSSYGTYLQDQILWAEQQDERYRELKQMLQ